MNPVHVYDDKQQLAGAAAEVAVTTLRRTVDTHGSAIWALAGGSTPLAAYEVVVTNYRNALDWSKITFIIGDERIGELDGPDNNWHAVDQILSALPAKRIRPQSNLSAEEAAADYNEKLSALPKSDSGLGLLRIDLLWLGMGEDGHTLSIFPGHSSLSPSSDIVIPVHDSPKPPLDRISLSLRALLGVKNVMILASGSDKQAALASALNGGHAPIALAANIIETHSGTVAWFIDKAAAPTD